MQSNRVSKPGLRSTIRRNDLLSSILSSDLLINMPSCSFCESRGSISCQVSPLDSTRCSECVRLNQARCDVLGPDPAHLRGLTAKHLSAEKELEDAEEELERSAARVRRLRKQKKMWFEKMMRAVRRGIDSVEELERVEREEAQKEEERVKEARPASACSQPLGDSFEKDWDDLYGHVPLDPSLIATFGFVAGSPPTTSDNQSGST